MARQPIRFGLAAAPDPATTVSGELAAWRGDTWYRVGGYDLMDPFFIALVSEADLWMYLSSRGGLAAGRRDPDHSLFPYETVDKLHVSHPHTGPRTTIRVWDRDAIRVWEPFADDGHARYEIARFLYKHVLGCELWFEERNVSLGLTFRYGWRPSDRFGWVRTCELANDDPEERRVDVLDGVQNLMPAGVHKSLQESSSSLVDAYKTAERVEGTTLALYRLSANIVDRAEASEALRATVAWASGFDDGFDEKRVFLGGDPWNAFALGDAIESPAPWHGRRSSYLVAGSSALAPGDTRRWHTVLDTPVDQAGVVALRNALASGAAAGLEEDIARGRDHLRALLGGADAFQHTGDAIATAHHVSNVLFNIARGGVLPDGYEVDTRDVADFVATRNRPVAARHAEWLRSLPRSLPLGELHERADATGDTDVVRLCDEYLPLVFSRRHGDPSRPWNRFSIETKNADGSVRYAYQGNWRDIFQNWEALCRSFPEILEPVVAKFVNASTVDGFNPYRITRDGIDWEVPDPDNPWSAIGYWGDHQIVYLTRLLEASRAHHPERLARMLVAERFSYADVPYDIRPWRDIVANPQDTVVFDRERQRAADERVAKIGSDGRLVHRDRRVLHVNLGEKLLVPILAKLCNLVPGGGIWMNTMRPEWNDANNALVGNGVSVVTACYLHRHLGLCAELFEAAGAESIAISSRVADWMATVATAIEANAGTAFDDERRRAFMDAVGGAFSSYRAKAYDDGPGAPRPVAVADIVALLRSAQSLVAHTIEENRRSEGLYHAYNLLHLGDDGAAITRLPLMLEGQVAALGSGSVAPEEVVALLDALRASDLYREDQHSYLLYPAKTLPSFLEKNRVPDEILSRAPALAKRVAAGDTSIVARDADGQLRFHADFRNAATLRERLGDAFPPEETRAILDAYEAVFDHKSFTGRSGTMYGYEGIGCIYWHMVAKLLLAVQEAFEDAVARGAAASLVEKLRAHYYDIRAGLGFTKTPEVFGALPLDPYSHTPGFGGAKQPGMTGQVKEEILTRWGELGVHVSDGCIRFAPALLRDDELLGEAATFSYVDGSGASQSIELAPGDLAFTFCQVPVVYVRGDVPSITVSLADGGERRIDGAVLPRDLSADVFNRTARVTRVTVARPAG